MDEDKLWTMDDDKWWIMDEDKWWIMDEDKWWIMDDDKWCVMDKDSFLVAMQSYDHDPEEDMPLTLVSAGAEVTEAFWKLVEIFDQNSSWWHSPHVFSDARSSENTWYEWETGGLEAKTVYTFRHIISKPSYLQILSLAKTF